MTEKQRIAKWDEFVKMILESTSVDEEEPDDARRLRKEYLEADPEEWFRYYFPRFAFAEPAPFHKEATRRILDNKEWYEVRIWSRELAKSTRTMMEVFYLTLVGHNPTKPVSAGENSGEIKRCVLLVSNSLDNAERLLMPYKANLQYNRRIIQDYGEQYNHGHWEATEFITQQGVAFRAIGAGQSPRGTKNDEVRPDIIIFDDVDTDADCLNPELVAKKWHWIEEAAIGTRSVSGSTTILFCGNLISRNSCIERATHHADYVDWMNIRDADGHSTWPQKNSEVDIDRVLGQKSYAAQQKEYFNNPLSEGSVFKEMAYKPARPLREYSTLVCYTDPSYKTTNDYKATVLVGRWQREFHVIRCYLAQATTSEMIQWHLNIMDLVDNNACYYFMEQVFMQDVLIKEVCDAGRRIGRPIPIRGDTRKKPDKFQRIESLLEPLVNNGELYLNETEKQNPHMVRLEEQFKAFAPGSHAHDDGPDAIEGAIWHIVQRENQLKPAPFRSYPRPNNDKRW